MTIRETLALLAFLCIVALARPAAAQCEPRWLPGDGAAGVRDPNGQGFLGGMTIWDPDGPGPLPARLVVGGELGFVGDVDAEVLAAWTGEVWERIPPRSPISVSRIFGVWSWGEKLVAVDGGILHVWDGQQWESLPAGFTSIPTAMLEFQGELVVSGGFNSSNGGNPLRRIARWDGASWKPLAGGFDDTVNTLAIHEGALFAAGRFTEADGQPASRIARWDGLGWSPVGEGLNGPVEALLSTPEGLVAGGSFSASGAMPLNGVARWNGEAWSAMSSGLAGVRCLAIHNGEVYAGGQFVSNIFNPLTPSHVARWDGVAWRHLAEGIRWDVAYLASFQGDLYAGGPRGGVVQRQSLLRWDGHAWLGIGPGFNDAVRVLTPTSTGLIAGGRFRNAGSGLARRVAQWDGVEWRPLGEGIAENPPSEILAASVEAVHEASPQNLLVGGNFIVAGGAPHRRIARWDGASWSDMAGGFMLGSVNSIIEFRGETIVAGSFNSATTRRIVRWTGDGWEQLGDGLDFQVQGLCVFQDTLIAVGVAATGGGGARISRWDGDAWASMDADLVGGSVRAAVVHEGYLIVAGRLESFAGTPLANVARWDGQSWVPMGAGLNKAVYDLGLVGDALFATGSFTGRVARWDGSQWLPFVGGPDGEGYALSTFAGELLVGGDFARAGGNVSAYFARYTFTNAPWVARHPQPFAADPGTVVTLSATAAIGYDNLTFQWQREAIPGSGQWLNLSDGPGGASPGAAR